MRLKNIIKKWYIILICAVLCASGLYFEKSMVVPAVPPTGDIMYIRIVKLNQIPTETLNETNIEINLDKLIKAWPNLSILAKTLDDNFDMQRLNPKWRNMSQSQKIDWIANHYRINWVGPGMYELIFQMKKDEVKDAEYIKENHEKLMEEYKNYFQESAGMVTNDTNLTTVKSFELVDDKNMPTVQQIEKKYAVIGFVLGALIGIVIVMVWNARKRLA